MRAGAVKSAVLAFLAGVVVAAVGVWPGDIPLFWAVALGVPAAALTVVGSRFAGPLEPMWSAVPDESGSATEMQAANLVTRLAEAAADPTRFQSRVQPRLRRLAVATLRGRPGTRDLVDLTDPRARPALGDELHELLTSPVAVLPPAQRVAELLDRLEEA